MSEILRPLATALGPVGDIVVGTVSADVMLGQPR
jgi:hypothetical protein